MTTTGTPSRESEYSPYYPSAQNTDISGMVLLHTADTGWDLNDSSRGSANSTLFELAACTHGLWVAANRSSVTFVCKMGFCTQ